MPHPDEGLIHAWLDGQLPPDEAARVERLVATDPAWAEAVAEARGLVAASSRILAALDHVPAGVIPQGTASRPARRLPWWTKAAAAVVLVVGGSVVVMQRAPDPMTTPAAVQTPAILNPTVIQKDAPRAVQAPPAIARQSAPASIAVAKAPRPTTDALSKPPAATAAVAAPTAPAEALPVPPPAPLALRSAAPAQPTDDSIGRATLARDVARRAKRDVTPRETVLEQMVVAGMPAKKSTVMGGVSAFSARAGACYGVRDANVPSDAGVVMRVVRTDGDTLFLEPMQGRTSLRAWVIWRDGAARGAMSAAPDARGAVPVVATPAACPAP